ncbi:MAG: AAA family ATPase [Anaerolineaceae bacterium]|nr:AAA family ATPase [Anaerolineaceae bacterium]MDE0327838.1 AAA family ATPase [Anaerolineaceae bacterium]
MYSSFRVQNFRGFKDLRLDDLARVNLIAGKNNTGKTALLEAIYTYTGVYDSSMLLRIPVDQRRSFKSYRLEEGAELINPGWPLLFHNFETSREIQLCGQNAGQGDLELLEDGTCSGKSQQLVISLEDPDRLYELATRRIDLERVVDESGRVLVFREGLNYWVSFNPYTRSRNTAAVFVGPQMTEEALRDTRYDSRFLSVNATLSADAEASLFTDVRLSGQDKSLLSVARIIDPRTRHFELLTNGLRIELHVHLEGLKQPLPFSSMGDGMRHIISLMLAIANTEDGIVLVDEIENGLHYSVQVDVWKAIAEAARACNVQIFATTHSYEMVRAASEAFQEVTSENFRLYRLDRSMDDNEITAVTYDEETLDAAIEAGFEVR